MMMLQILGHKSVGFGGNKRKDALVFVLDNKAYLGTGLRNGAYENDFYVFDGDFRKLGHD